MTCAGQSLAREQASSLHQKGGVFPSFSTRHGVEVIVARFFFNHAANSSATTTAKNR